MSKPHALVLGASGISGWSLVNQLRSYPSPTTWNRITGTTNRPFSFAQARIPEEERIKLVHGINLTKSVEKIVEDLRREVSDIDTVTHVFFTAYIQKETFAELKEVNDLLLSNSIRAIEMLSPNLQSVILQTGGKGYGFEFPEHIPIKPPMREDMPRIPKPWYDNIFYYSQYDLLQKLSQSKKWTFTEIRPDGIVGFVPGSNAMNLAQGIALYLSIYREVNGEGAEVPFPGEEHGYYSTHSDTFQDLLAKMEIHASLNPNKCGDGRAFNIVDGNDPVTWSQVWPGLCSYFGLKGVGPKPGSQSIQKFIESHQQGWDSLCSKYGLQTNTVKEQNWGFVHFMLVQFDFDRQYDMSRAREVGFSESIDTVEGYRTAFARMAEAAVIPRFREM